ncbi:MAG: TonB-dependent receptor [Acidobacteriaceae bacterium]|nr:TonB-dependent receptor [Acidobacteriaceae bacterium]
MTKLIQLIAVCLLLATVLCAQNSIIRGTVQDETNAVIPNAKVTATGPRGIVRSVTSGPDGSFNFAALPVGSYNITATSPGLTQFQPTKVELGASPVSVNIQLRVAVETQQVTVQETTAPAVTTDPAQNAGQIILKGEDLSALSDDPDDLESDLQALAGPSAGPNGGQIYIDGFTGGRLPPKESIREVRINSNPFSAEFDRLGFGRIEIFTKPGTDKLRGQAFFNISDGTFNSRNPYLTSTNSAPFQSKMFGGNLGGPLGKKASFFVDFERRNIDDDGIISATILDPNTLLPTPYSNYVATPQRRTTISPRVDYQLTTNNSITARYSYTRNDLTNQGVGQFNLQSRGYNQLNQLHTAQLTDTQIIGAKAINETRFQYQHINDAGLGDNTLPALNVSQAFNGGGAQVGKNYDIEDHYEIQNYTSYSSGAHAWKFGVRMRTATLNSLSPSNFGGTYSFTGGFVPVLDPTTNLPVVAGVVCDPVAQTPGCQTVTSLERYRRTLLYQRMGLSPTQIAAYGGGPTQFSISTGTPYSAVDETDLGFFVQDDWRVRPNITLSLGLRYEVQTNISDYRDWAPRIGIAWAPGGKGNVRPKTVFRGGFGIFYDRFDDTYTLQALRFSLINPPQINYIASGAAMLLNYYPNVPPTSALTAVGSAGYQVDKNLRAPYTIQSAIGVERQLPKNTTIAVNYTNSRGVHLLRSRDINAPLPGTYTTTGTGVRPYGGNGEIFQYESDGFYRQNQLFVNVRNQANRYVSLFGGYFLNFAHSDTDGANTFPANQYNLASEWGRAAIDSRNRMMLGGAITTKWDIRFSPFILANSGRPFNIYESRDLYGDTLLNTARPAFATDPNAPGVIKTAYGIFDPNPKPGETIVPRNFGEGPAFFSVNLRVSKTFGFGPERGPRNTGAQGMGGMPPGGGFGGGGGPRGGGMRGGGGPHGGGGGMDGTTNRRYNLTISANARNLFNTNNAGPYIGDITSPLFGTSNRLAGGFGAEANPANNRRIEFGLRFAF